MGLLIKDYIELAPSGARINEEQFTALAELSGTELGLLNGAMDPSLRNLKTRYGAVGDGVTDDTAALNLAIADFNLGYSIFIPQGNYKYTSTLTTLTTTSKVGQRIVGEGYYSSKLIPTGAGVNGLVLGGTMFRANFEDFGIEGGSTTGVGIDSPATTAVFNSTWRSLYISMGSHAIRVLSHFSHTLQGIYAHSATGHGFLLQGAISNLLINCYAGIISQAYRAGYRIGHTVTMLACNGVDAGDYWLVIGSKANVNDTAQAGGASTITLAAGSSFATDEIIGLDIVITSGTGSGQTRTCSAYNSATKVATVSAAWATQPDATSVYSVRDPDFVDANNYPKYSLYNCNIEAFSKIGIRERQTALKCFLDHPSFTVTSGSYVSCYRMYGGDATTGARTALQNFEYFVSGATRTGNADVMADHSPALVGINMHDNSLYRVDTAATEYFNNLRSDGLDLPQIPTADPADGRRSVWANAAVLTRGT